LSSDGEHGSQVRKPHRRSKLDGLSDEQLQELFRVLSWSHHCIGGNTSDMSLATSDWEDHMNLSTEKLKALRQRCEEENGFSDWTREPTLSAEGNEDSALGESLVFDDDFGLPVEQMETLVRFYNWSIPGGCTSFGSVSTASSETDLTYSLSRSQLGALRQLCDDELDSSVSPSRRAGAEMRWQPPANMHELSMSDEQLQNLVIFYWWLHSQDSFAGDTGPFGLAPHHLEQLKKYYCSCRQQNLSCRNSGEQTQRSQESTCLSEDQPGKLLSWDITTSEMQTGSSESDGVTFDSDGEACIEFDGRFAQQWCPHDGGDSERQVEENFALPADPIHEDIVSPRLDSVTFSPEELHELQQALNRELANPGRHSALSDEQLQDLVCFLIWSAAESSDMDTAGCEDDLELSLNQILQLRQRCEEKRTGLPAAGSKQTSSLGVRSDAPLYSQFGDDFGLTDDQMQQLIRYCNAAYGFPATYGVLSSVVLGKLRQKRKNCHSHPYDSEDINVCSLSDDQLQNLIWFHKWTYGPVLDAEFGISDEHVAELKLYYCWSQRRRKLSGKTASKTLQTGSEYFCLPEDEDDPTSPCEAVSYDAFKEVGFLLVPEEIDSDGGAENLACDAFNAGPADAPREDSVPESIPSELWLENLQQGHPAAKPRWFSMCEQDPAECEEDSAEESFGISEAQLARVSRSPSPSRGRQQLSLDRIGSPSPRSTSPAVESDASSPRQPSIRNLCQSLGDEVGIDDQVVPQELPAMVSPAQTLEPSASVSTDSALASSSSLEACEVHQDVLDDQAEQPTTFVEKQPCTEVVSVQVVSGHSQNLHTPCNGSLGKRDIDDVVSLTCDHQFPEVYSCLDATVPQPGDVVIIGGQMIAEFHGRPGVVMRVAAGHQAHCTVMVLDDTRLVGIAECWPTLADVEVESSQWRLYTRVLISGVQSTSGRSLKGSTGTIIPHPQEGHPNFLHTGSPSYLRRLAFCIRLDDPPTPHQATVLVDARFLVPQVRPVQDLPRGLQCNSGVCFQRASDRFHPGECEHNVGYVTQSLCASRPRFQSLESIRSVGSSVCGEDVGFMELEVVRYCSSLSLPVPSERTSAGLDESFSSACDREAAFLEASSLSSINHASFLDATPDDILPEDVPIGQMSRSLSECVSGSSVRPDFDWQRTHYWQSSESADLGGLHATSFQSPSWGNSHTKPKVRQGAWDMPDDSDTAASVACFHEEVSGSHSPSCSERTTADTSISSDISTLEVSYESLIPSPGRRHLSYYAADAMLQENELQFPVAIGSFTRAQPEFPSRGTQSRAGAWWEHPVQALSELTGFGCCHCDMPQMR
jgi:hypothetical protein